MLTIKNVHKEYKTGTLVQKALDGVSLSFRETEFVAVLGPSGSGKTTLLNVIGGLDRYDSGEMFIRGVPTSRYSDRDWDTYRNHTIGFVFQSYNLIPHQTVRGRESRADAAGHGSVRARGACGSGAEKAVPAFGRPDAARSHCQGVGERALRPAGG